MPPTQQFLHALAKFIRTCPIRQPRPLHFSKRIRHLRVGIARVVNHDRQQERRALRHEMRALVRQPPFESKVTFSARLRRRRNDRNQQRAVFDLSPDFVIPGITADELALVEPDLDPDGAECVGNAFRRLCVLRRVAEENRAARDAQGFDPRDSKVDFVIEG